MAMNKDFGAFELKEKIGSGGMASVYLAVQKSLARPVVLKILYPHLAEDEKLNLKPLPDQIARQRRWSVTRSSWPRSSLMIMR